MLRPPIHRNENKYYVALSRQLCRYALALYPHNPNGIHSQRKNIQLHYIAFSALLISPPPAWDFGAGWAGAPADQLWHEVTRIVIRGCLQRDARRSCDTNGQSATGRGPWRIVEA
jgi:hypothetical protein